jgi:hypothetical protein
MPGIPYGQAFYDGVRYIKVNRYDSGGLDRSDYLGQLQSITLTYPDRSAIEYPITTIQEQANYYLYGIPVGYDTSSKGNINDYGVTSSKANIQGPTIGNLIKVKNYSTTIGNTLGYFNSTTGVYTFGDTPNIPVKVNVNISNVSNAATTHSIYKNSTGDTYSTFFPINTDNLLGLVIGNGSIDITLTGSLSLTETETLAVYTYNLSNSASATVSMSIYNTTPQFNGSSSLVVFDPDAINFDYNDYNPLLGNAEVPQYSTVWMDVDYSQNPLTPVNFGLIISGTADRAFVQDSNYSSKAWSNLRYNGSRTNSYITT